MAKANLESLSQELKKAQSGGRVEEIEAAEAGIKKLRADLNAANHALEDTQLKAPYDGYISAKFVENYENVQPGMPIVGFIDLSSVEVHTSVPEEIIIHKGDITHIQSTVSAYPGKKFEASIKEIGRKTDSANQSYPFTVVLDLPENLVVSPGMAATLSITLANSSKPAKGVLLPSQAIFADPTGKTCVWRIDTEKMIVIKTPVTIGTLKNGTVQVLSELSPGDRIVTAGARFLQENQKIRILNAGAEKG
jgi:RND family efflux transporter MFP subunit